MDCPRCNVEMVALENDDHVMQRCDECGGLWTDGAELSRLLVHNNLPVLARFGGKSNLDEIAGICPDCNVDLTVVEGRGDNAEMYYESCEGCGGVFLDVQSETGGWKVAEAAIAAYFRPFKPA